MQLFMTKKLAEGLSEWKHVTTAAVKSVDQGFFSNSVYLSMYLCICCCSVSPTPHHQHEIHYFSFL